MRGRRYSSEPHGLFFAGSKRAIAPLFTDFPFHDAGVRGVAFRCRSGLVGVGLQHHLCKYES